MIKRRLFCLLLAVLVLTSGLNVTVLSTSGLNSSVECIGLDAQTSFLGDRALITNAKSVFLYETESDILMYAWNADDRIYPASLVKIMTALIAVEQGKLADVIVAKEDVLSTIPKSAVSVDLKTDELMTLEDLLYCMMVESANDAAVVIADHIGGDLASFVSAMNQRASEIGCTNTVFTNVHGLHDDDQYSTARDVAKILAVASENETFMKIFSAAYYDVPATNKSGERYLSSGNYLMNRDEVQIYYDSRVIGGRTGTDKNGYRCMATVASENGLKYISVVTGSLSFYEKDGYTVRSFGSYNETKSLLDLGFNGNSRGQVFYKGQSVKQQAVINGDNDVVLGASSDVYAIVPNDAVLTYRYRDLNPEIHAPIQQGEVISTVEVWCNSVCIAQTELYAMNTVQVAGTAYTEVEHDDNWKDILITVIACLLGVVVLAVIGIYAQRRFGIFRRRKSPQHRRPEQKRDR